MTTKRKGTYAHLDLFDARDWGLIIYDEAPAAGADLPGSPPTSRRADGSG